MFKNITVAIYGTSHDRYIGCTVTGLEIGHRIDLQQIKEALLLRQGDVLINTARQEEDEIIFLSGVDNLEIVDTKISFVIENKDTVKKDYLKGVIRPGHADYIGYQSDGLLYNYAGGGKFSGRLTVLYVIVGSICQQLIKMKVYGHIKQVGDLIDDPISTLDKDNLIKLEQPFPMINQLVKQKVFNQIKEVKKNNDSIGGRLAFRVIDPVFGLGGYGFESFESYLSSNLFAIGAIKGISFGLGQEYLNVLGSQANGEIQVDDNGKIFSPINLGGGINGGFTNGYEDILFECIIRPTPSIFKKQKTIILKEDGYHNYLLELQGRHDTFIGNRALHVIKAMTYITLYDLLKKGE